MSDKRRIGKKPKMVAFAGGEDTMAAMRALGLDPKAPPMSGRCVMCGKTLNTDSAVGEIDKDHSICNRCFPPSMADWQGYSTDYIRLDLDGPGGPTATEIRLPADPFEN